MVDQEREPEVERGGGEASPPGGAGAPRSTRERGSGAGRLLGVLAGTLLIGAVAGGAAGSLAASRLQPTSTPAVTAVASPVPTASRGATSAPTVAPQPATLAVQQQLPGAQGFAALYERAAPGVVYIAARGDAASGVGSGVVLDSEGHILTNNHVVAEADRLTVRLADGTEGEARVLGRDPGGDLALLRADLPADRLVPLPLGDSDAVRPGEVVVAIGNPLGLSNTITAGIVSAIDRTQAEGRGRPLRGLIQTDAAINPGNSGGPLLNLNGEVIGITTLGLGRGGAQGINFAVPINDFKRLRERLLAGEVVQRPWLGISGRDITPSNKDELGVSVDSGVLIAQVVPDSPAARAGLRGGQGPQGEERGGDVIVAVAGQPIRSTAEIGRALDQHSPGDVVQVKILREGSERTLDVTLAPWPTS